MTEFNAFDVSQVASTTQPRNRSRACLHCRRRKMRCDGIKPACFQCVRADRGSECEYDDGTTKTATQLLYEKLHRLEKRYRELQASHPRSGSGAHGKSSSSKRGSTLSASASSSRGGLQTRSSGQFQHNKGGYFATASASSGSSVASTPTPPLPQLHLEPLHAPFNPPPSFYDKTLPPLSYAGPDIMNAHNTSLHIGSNAGAFLGADPYSYTQTNDLHSSMNMQFPGPLDTPEPYYLGEVTEEPTPALAQYLIESFLPHTQQCGLSIRSEFLVHGSRTPSPVSNQQLHDAWHGTSTPPSPPLSQVTHQLHPALINAVYMWGAHFATDRSVLPLASIFAKRTSDELPALVQLVSGSSSNSSSDSSRYGVAPHVLIQAIQAATLLATYYFAHDRSIEGAYHANTASVLALSAGLHRMTSPRHSSGTTFADGDDYNTYGAGQIVLPPSRDNLEWAERLLTFWNVYVLEGSWGAVEGFPNARWNGHELRARITAPWPKDLEMYGEYSPMLGHQTHSGQERSSGCTVSSFLAGRNVNPSPSRLELRAKSAALFEQAAGLAKNRDPASQDFRSKFATAQAAAQQFLRAIPAPSLHDYQSPSFTDCTLITTRATVLATDIRLHYDLACGSAGALERCLGASREIVRGVSLLVPEDYLYLEPIIASCWSLAAMVFVRVLCRMPPSTAGMNERVQIHSDVEKLINALKVLGTIFPGAASQALKIEAMLRGKRPCE